MSNIPDDEETIKKLWSDKQQLIGMILRIRKAFYEVGTTKAMRETMREVNEEFKILREGVQS